MTGRIEARLADLGITLPTVGAPVANYVPTVRTGNLVFVSGQVPMKDGKPAYSGLCGREVGLEDAQAAARLCALNMLAHVKAACGSLDKVVRVVRIGGFVASGADYVDHPKVVNGASDLMVEIFGDAGRHARAAVGCSSLPLGVPVEVEGLFEVRD